MSKLLSLEQLILNAALRLDFGTFVAKAFRTIRPDRQYLHNWHIDAIVYELLRVYRKQNRRIVVTQPPRSLKSICISVAFVAWVLGRDPGKRFAVVSYSLELAATLARQFRAVVTSGWYRDLFPRVRFTKDTETECETSLGGGRFVVPVGGSFTGRGADIIIIDDPLKSDEAQSEAARRNVNEWYSTTLLSRLDDKRHGAIIVVAQRLHEDDLPGRLLREDGWHHLDLPAIAEEDQEIPIGPGVVHHRRKGELLHPEYEPLYELERIKREMGPLVFASQFQQRPLPPEGNLIKRDSINWYEAPPSRQGARVVQSWDVASTLAETSDWSVCTTWLISKRSYFLLDVWRGRVEFPQVRRKLVELASQHRPNVILVEQAGPGLHLIQDLRANPVAGVPVPIGIKPDHNKLDRMAAQSARFDARQVHLPKEAPWLGDFLREILGFPHTRHDDQVDSVSQFLNWAEAYHMRYPAVSVAGPMIFVDGRWIGRLPWESD